MAFNRVQRPAVTHAVAACCMASIKAGTVRMLC